MVVILGPSYSRSWSRGNIWLHKFKTRSTTGQGTISKEHNRVTATTPGLYQAMGDRGEQRFPSETRLALHTESCVHSVLRGRLLGTFASFPMLRTQMDNTSFCRTTSPSTASLVLQEITVTCVHTLLRLCAIHSESVRTLFQWGDPTSYSSLCFLAVWPYASFSHHSGLSYLCIK